MKIKLSKSQWEKIGEKAGWIKLALPARRWENEDDAYDRWVQEKMEEEEERKIEEKRKKLQPKLAPQPEPAPTPKPKPTRVGIPSDRCPDCLSYVGEGGGKCQSCRQEDYEEQRLREM